MKAKDQIDALVCAALNMLDCKDDLTPDERLCAEQIYSEANHLEGLLEERQERLGSMTLEQVSQYNREIEIATQCGRAPR